MAPLVKPSAIALRLAPSAAFARSETLASTKVMLETPATFRLASASDVDVDISPAAVSSIA